MGTHWLDLFLVVIVVTVIRLESKRGFSRAFFDLASLLIAFKLVSAVYGSAAKSFVFTLDPTTNQAVVFLGLFFVVGAGFWLIGKLISDALSLTFEMFDPILGAVFGIAVAVVVGHALTQALAIAGTVDGMLPDTLTRSFLGLEFYDFKTYNDI